MAYEYLEDIAIGDAAFEATGKTVEALFVSACDATMNLMVEDLQSIADRERRPVFVEESSLDMLLFQLLQEIIYFKDAEQLLLRIHKVQIDQGGEGCRLTADAVGETIDPAHHQLLVDVKAVTLHRLSVEQTEQGWIATVVLDV